MSEKKKIVGFMVLFLLVTASLFVMRPKSMEQPPTFPLPPTTQSDAATTQANTLSRTAGSSLQASKSDQSATTQSSSPNAVVVKKPTPKLITIDNKQYPLRTYAALAMPNDPSANQWWVTNATVDQAWSLPAGSTQTKLAIIDSGFALKHEEFSGRWDANSGESGSTANEAASKFNCTDRSLAIAATCNLIDDDHDGTVDNESGTAVRQNPSRLNCTGQGKALDKSCNRIDDDGNGYIDDTTGWDFINYDNLAQAGETNAAGTNTSHGTMVAGIAAATGNNAKGIAGVDWQTRILPIQALNDDGYGDTLSVGRSIFYAISRHVDVISISLGSAEPDDYVRQAVQAALKQGIVVVAAAGNDGCDCMVYPGAYPEAVGVGALNASNQLASFSSFGENLDIVAPGTNLTSTTWQSGNPTNAYAAGLNGTSFSTPLVAGLLTRLKSLQPTASPIQLLAAVTENANRLGLSAVAPHDSHFGFGAVDSARAVSRMSSARTGEMAYAYNPVSLGNKLYPTTPVEPVHPTLVYQCEGQIPTTLVYELKSSSGNFFTASAVENQLATEGGYGSSKFIYACVQEPHDTMSVRHTLDLFKEFRNDYQRAP